MTIVSNTSPICYLVLVEQIQILPALFGEIFIPKAVLNELRQKGAPENVRCWAASPPEWVHCIPVSMQDDFFLRRLHQGEQDAILLAEQLSADLILLDDKAARNAAAKRGLPMSGLIGVLDRAATAGMIELAPVIRRLNRTSFRVAPHLLKYIVEKHYP